MARILPEARGTRWLERGEHGATIAQLRAALREAVYRSAPIDQKTGCEAEFVLSSYSDRMGTSLALTGKPINEQDVRRMKLVVPFREKGAIDWPKRARGRPRKESV